MNGYRIRIRGKEYFIISNYQKVTDNFLDKICRKFELPSTTGIYSELRYYLQKASCELKHTVNKNIPYWSVKGTQYQFGETFNADDENPELFFVEINK